MSDILLSKEIVGGETNFQVVGCTIDVGTKIYAARVDALHKNTYQVLSGLGHANSDDQNGENITNNETGNNDLSQMDNENQEAGEEETEAKSKSKSKKRRNKKSSHIVENLDTITCKAVDDYKDDDLYFSKISICTEQEGIAGILLNKLHAANDSNRILINGDDLIYPECETYKNAGKLINLKPLIESKSNHDLSNLKLCPDLDTFRFIGWNCETSDEISKLIEKNSQRNNEELEAHRFDVNNLHTSLLNNTDIDPNNDNYIDSEDGLHSDNEMGAHHMEDIHEPENVVTLFDKIDDLKSLHSITDLTTLISTSASEYSYFDFDKLKLSSLPAHLKLIAAKLGSNEAQQINLPKKVARVARNKKDLTKISFATKIDRMKFIKITKKATFIADRTIEKRNEKPCRLESERQIDLLPRDLLRPYYKKITVRFIYYYFIKRVIFKIYIFFKLNSFVLNVNQMI